MANKKKVKKLSKDYPFFKAQDIAQKILLESKVVFANGGSSGRTFKRSAMVSSAQAEFLRVVILNVLTILQYETQSQFEKRWSHLVKLSLIHI